MRPPEQPDRIDPHPHMPPTAYVRPVETGVDLDLAALRRVLGSLALRQRRGAESRALLAAVVERRRLT